MSIYGDNNNVVEPKDYLDKDRFKEFNIKDDDDKLGDVVVYDSSNKHAWVQSTTITMPDWIPEDERTEKDRP